jgi:putative CocE/NonD family hydrolase
MPAPYAGSSLGSSRPASLFALPLLPRGQPMVPCQAEKQYNVPAKMRDGVTLYADVYRPKGAGSYPVILMRLPYNKDAAQTYVYAPPQFYASHCYIVVIQDVRGQYASEGSFYAFRDEVKDGYDTIEWAAKLPGSNGKVGMYGSSYVGATQWLPATLQPPSLVAIAPAMTRSSLPRNREPYRGAYAHRILKAEREQDLPLAVLV